MAAPRGNKNAAKAKGWEGAVRHELARDRKRLYRIAEQVLKAAEAGEAWAVTEVGNTLDGKPTEHVKIDQTVEHVLTYGDYLAGKTPVATAAADADTTVQ